MSAHRPFPGLFILLGLACAMVGFAWLLRQGGESPASAEHPVHPQPALHSQPVPPPAAEKPGLALPSFDIVRVNPQGGTVLAGRAAPGAGVTILDNGQPLGNVTADGRGEWVIVLDRPLTGGQHELSLSAKARDGSQQVSDAPLVMAIPASGAAGDAVAVRMNHDGSSDILHGPKPGAGAAALAIAAVSQPRQDKLIVSGQAPAGSRIRLYLDGTALADTRADAQGHWKAPLRKLLTSGPHPVRADQLAEDGVKVVARAETSFTPPAFPPPDGTVTVQPGNSLWRIARHVTGSGLSYVEIYRMNRDQIRNPDLIYPGQVLKVPLAPPP